MPREAAHVKLVDDGLGGWTPDEAISFPIVAAGIGDDALHRGCGIVSALARGGSRVVVRDGDGQAVGIEKHLLRIEPQPALGRERSVGAVRVDLPGPQVRNEDMPVVIRPM